MLEDLSAASFCIGDAVEKHAIDEYLQCCQPADTRFGVCGVGGALHINTFKHVAHAHEPDVSFMDTIADGFGLSDPDPPLAMHCMGPVVSVDSVSVAGEDSEDADDGLPPPRQALGCGKPPCIGLRQAAMHWAAASRHWALGAPP
ncbi:hypothetical protein CYMTET_18134 [Cymbomonas tetramitiformis]|uniref:Uncharacterized protein n=1 Tax=Cymbomonas tetramitiformis TaxID=36881 RepID=A0AAE0L6K4_9CHLO|nr:hypothetical protein CYMTET_18134 [Cymbomonas tetramitiformis]